MRSNIINVSRRRLRRYLSSYPAESKFTKADFRNRSNQYRVEQMARNALAKLSSTTGTKDVLWGDLEHWVKSEPFYQVQDIRNSFDLAFRTKDIKQRPSNQEILDFFKTCLNTFDKTSLTFETHEDGAGSLIDALELFRKRGINLTHIESRPSVLEPTYSFYVSVQGTLQDNNVRELVNDLIRHTKNVTLMGTEEFPWFPRKISDIDVFCHRTLDAGAELQSDHPGFKDADYRERRKKITESASRHRFGEPIPGVKYVEDEIKTWSMVFDKLQPLTQKYACQEYLEVIPELHKDCGFRRDNIPQLQDVSEYLKSKTGFIVRPVSGLLSSRDFLNGLAFKVFFSTQYIRHHSKPLYTPEPDVCHEILGHVPLFANPEFAAFSQEIGLASIGATDEQIQQLARVYWFSVEFGQCRENGERKAYGAGLLSSFGELEYSMSSEPELKDFDPFTAGNQDYPITTYQPLYFVAESFKDAQERMRVFAQSLKRPFNVRYNSITASLDIDRDITVTEDGIPSKVSTATYGM
mmetsp:Transcript_9096/g.13637  ORF Transcript_9096/g.13637 Transcript_9096/m.13637 type:complete len:523 (+) Transcript_9096:57-1625(+)|eukprot:CAMPEP_0167745332 /NCGR_PEP_ID=MMETSP0110_2-20121227/3094_1 /TAXON_ID=629695 /ORGANISM="Gymnochlora sp., Strain CCMP2014" /LENGTH=522 /DNA_ID=CAMNT_0007629965 /DNA_START=12 /DNA_END=1580 /DNA_ORIENTATION=-